MKKIGAIISSARKKAHLTQEAFAARLGITPQAVSKWENDVGYPDVTLLPEISKILGVSLDELFGTDIADENGGFSFPEKKDGLDFICSFGDTACYSDKAVENFYPDSGVVQFTDGSVAYLAEGLATNTGRGEIRFAVGEPSATKLSGGKTVFEEAVGDFDSIDISLSFGTSLEVVKAGDGIGKVYAEGQKEFIALIAPKVVGKTLGISANRRTGNNGSNGERHNRLVISAPFDKGCRLALKLSGACDAKIKPAFEELSSFVSGSGDLDATGCDILEMQVSGSADLRIGTVSESADCRISGSGDLNIGMVNNLKVGVSGSGDIDVDAATGVMDITISGAGDMHAGGTLERLKLQMSGAGDFKGKELTVNEAELTARGSTSIHIGRIKTRSSENLSANSTLVVDHRG